MYPLFAAKGIRAFKDGLKDEELTHEKAPVPPGAIANESTLERQAGEKH